MSVEDVCSITGRGIVATGRVERGTVQLGDSIELLGFESCCIRKFLNFGILILIIVLCGLLLSIVLKVSTLVFWNESIGGPNPSLPEILKQLENREIVMKIR
jgi:hypothetical protein